MKARPLEIGSALPLRGEEEKEGDEENLDTPTSDPKWITVKSESHGAL